MQVSHAPFGNRFELEIQWEQVEARSSDSATQGSADRHNPEGYEFY